LPPKLLRRPDINEARKIVNCSGGALKMVILAPELKGAPALIRFFRKHRIVTSLGHTAATYAQAERGIDAGIRHATHTFNRMGSFNHRAPGVLGAVLTDNRVSCEAIADGIHIHPAALKLLLNCKGLDKVMLITDSTAALVRADKRRSGDVFRLKDGTLYGTALTLNKALKNALRFLRLTLPELVRLVSLNPARVLKIEKRKGTLGVGKDADLVIFDKNFDVKLTVVEGKIVYSKVSERVRNNRIYRQS
jgi:N-acetylglucosamine-6-phosphate deacetylase